MDDRQQTTVLDLLQCSYASYAECSINGAWQMEKTIFASIPTPTLQLVKNTFSPVHQQTASLSNEALTAFASSLLFVEAKATRTRAHGMMPETFHLPESHMNHSHKTEYQPLSQIFMWQITVAGSR